MLWPRSFGGSVHAAVPDIRADVEAWCASEGIARPTDDLIADYYVPMAAWVAEHVDDRTLVLGLNGAQGTGKSTLARLLQQVLARVHGIRAAILSLDDLYLSGAQRLQRAQSIHPLLATRGVPGTHDVDLGLRVLRCLREGRPIALPRFHKAKDERWPVAGWPPWEGRCDLVIFEGWCMGARPQRADELQTPVNELEREEDPTGDWRWYVNRELGGHYQALFAELDLLMMLRPPGFEQVYAWREEQEARLRAAGGGPRVMTPAEVRRFVMHFERLTRFTWEEMPGRADVVVRLGEDHVPADVELGDERRV
ncbi:MAG: kinase [Polyangiales bacterium]